MNAWHASVRVPYPGWLSFEEVDALVEKVRETAYPHPEARSLVITWTADTEWDLRGQVEETLREMDSNFRVEFDMETVTRFQGEARPFA